MFRLPSLSFSYIASTELFNSPHMEMMKELEVMERRMQGVIATVSDLTSQLRQMTSKEQKFNKEQEVRNVNLFCASSSKPMQCDETRQFGGVLEAASRLVGEVHMTKPGTKSLLGTSSVGWNENVLMKAGQVPKSPAFPVEKQGEKVSQRKFVGKSESFYQDTRSHDIAEDEKEEGDGLERGKNPVCLLQELLVANNANHLPKYHLVGEYGPGHSKIFTVTNTF